MKIVKLLLRSDIAGSIGNRARPSYKKRITEIMNVKNECIRGIFIQMKITNQAMQSLSIECSCASRCMCILIKSEALDNKINIHESKHLLHASI